MNYKIKKKIIMIAMIMIVIIIIVIVSILLFKQKNSLPRNENQSEQRTGYIPDSDTENYQLKELRDVGEFYSVENSIKKYENEDFDADLIESLDGNRVITYVVSGKIKENSIFYIVRVDTYNLTCEINESNVKKISDIKVESNQDEIADNGNNSFEYTRVTNEDSARMYYKEINEMEINDTKKAYSMLDKQYKEIRFPSLEDYEKYVNEYKETIQNAVISKYYIDEKDNYREYILVDNYNNSYTVRVKNVKNYTMLLDNYTVKVDSYAENYSSLDVENKVKSNIYIFIQMINTKDYNNAYKLLSEGFKLNYFKTEGDFESYIKEKWFKYNLLTDTDIKNEGNNYVCNLTLRSGAGASAEEAEKTIIMQLKEGTDFTMSFKVE